jgi:adenosylmethionine-8-amino-7-oxononanoate aminotransferase
MHALFAGSMPDQIMAELPTDANLSRAFDLLLDTHTERIAAVIVEPLVQGAGGMQMHDAATLACIGEACRRHGVLLIADEIMTGFGRTGRMFACEEASVTPDIVCLSKALTGGVADVRIKGAIGAVELSGRIDLDGLRRRFSELGVWVRPFGKVVYLMPPFVIEADDLSLLTGAVRRVLAERAAALP